MRSLALIILALACPSWSSPFFGGKTDPELKMEPEKLIQHWGYKAEVYEVITEDGYILPLYRIPQGKTENSTSPKPVVYLQHGLENSAADWVINLPSESAAFLFADAGFDVFIGNFRGTTYSKRHTALSPKDHLFWQFSWDQMAAFDLPALLGKTLEISKADKIYYVGHSMGTMTAFAQFSQNQELAQKNQTILRSGTCRCDEECQESSHVRGTLHQGHGIYRNDLRSGRIPAQ